MSLSLTQRKKASTIFPSNLWLVLGVFVVGYLMGSLSSQGTALQGSGSSGSSDGAVRNVRGGSSTTTFGVDLLPHLKNCDKPQSKRTLTEMAAHYKPTKFYGYMHTNFDRFYPQYMEKYRGKYFRMLEIGLDTGTGSLLWAEYFPCATLVGLEYKASNTETDGAAKIQTIQGDQGDADFLRTTFLEQSDGGNFDLIVDDGGHHYEQQRASYEVLFEKALNPGGLYVVEDIETSYWAKGTELYGNPVTRGGRQEPITIVNQFKEVVDVVNKKFHDNTFTVFGQVDQLISTIAFGSNVIFMEKKTKEHCWNERPYIWPNRLDGPAKDQALDANKGTLISQFCEGIPTFVRDKKNLMHNSWYGW